MKKKNQLVYSVWVDFMSSFLGNESVIYYIYKLY